MHITAGTFGDAHNAAADVPAANLHSRAVARSRSRLAALALLTLGAGLPWMLAAAPTALARSLPQEAYRVRANTSALHTANYEGPALIAVIQEHGVWQTAGVRVVTARP